MKKFLTVLLVVAVMFTFSFSGAFAMTTVVNAEEPDYQIGDFYYNGPAVHSGTQGGQGITDLELATVVSDLEDVVYDLAHGGKYTYFIANTTDHYGPGQTTTEDNFHGSHLKAVQSLVDSTLATVKAAKTSFAVDYALKVLDAKVFAETSRGDLMEDLKADATALDSNVTAGSLATAIDGTGTYLLPGYVQFDSNDTDVVLKKATDKADRAYNKILGWFFDNDFETVEEITGKKAAQAFEDAVVKVATAADETIYTKTANLNADGLILYHQAAALKKAVENADVTDMDAAYNAVKKFKDFENANVADGSYTNDDDVRGAAVAYYGAVNFDKQYAAIGKMSQKEVLAAKADVVALAESILAFEDKYPALDIYGNGKTYDLTTEFGYIELAGDDALAEAKIKLNVALPENLVAANKADFEAYAAAYDAYKAEFSNDIYEDVATEIDVATEAYILAGKANFEAAVKDDAKDAAEVQAKLNNATVKVTTQALGNKKIRVQAKIDAESFRDLAGYTVEYKFYKKTAKAAEYKGYSDRAVNYTTFKGLKAGTKYNFKCAVTVKDEDGNVVATKSYLGSTTGIRTAK